MPRHQLTDPQRETVADLFPTGNFKTGRRPRNRRAILNAIFWVLRTKTEAEELLQSFIRRYAKRAPGLVKWAET
ncbi:MAG: transposase, partial [Myxococcales bacterium]|nr:transposase [Myxococcales bacterium]